MRMCAIVAFGGFRQGVVCDFPPHAFDLLTVRSTQISIGELVAVILLFKHFPQVLAGKSTFVFVDNIGVIHNIVNGAARARDATSFSAALQHQIAAIATTSWWEYVESESNLSDGGSRDGCSCPLAKAAGIKLFQVELPPLSPNFPVCDPRDWAEWWKS